MGCLNGPLHVFAARPEQLRWSATLTSKLQDERRIEVIASEVPLWGGWFFCTSLPGTCYPGRMGFPMGLSRLRCCCGNTHLSATTLRLSISEPGLAYIQTSINRFSVTLRLSISEPGRAYIQTSTVTVSASPCG